MHSLSTESNVVSYDWFLAFGTDLSVWCHSLLSSIFACVAVDVSIILFVRKTNKILSAASAGEVIGMIFVAESSDALIVDGLLAVGTSWTEQLVVVILAVWFALVLYKRSVWKRHVAVIAHKVLWMPRLV